mgnify:CR=1 FL=1
MKKKFTLWLAALTACLASSLTARAALLDDGVYSISCQQAEGYVALGGKHEMAPYICFINDGGNIAADGYWVVTNTRSGYTFRNEVSGEYIVWTEGREDRFYKWMTLATEPESPSQFWTVEQNDDGSLSICSVQNPSYYWNLRASQGMLGTYAGNTRSANERYYFTKKGDSPGPSPDPVNPDPMDPATMTEFPAALHVYLADGRIEAYPLSYVTAHNQTGGQLVIETNIGQTFTYALTDVTSVSEEAPADFPMFESFKFNNKFNDQLFTDALGEIVGDTVNVTIAAIGKRLTPSFKVPDGRTLVYVGDELQESKVSRLRFDHDIYYTLTREGCKILLPTADGGHAMQPYGRLVCVHVDWLTDRAEVPTIYINTSDGLSITSKDYFKDATISIDGHDIFPSMEETPVQIKGRGNSSWGWPKKPYRLKFETKQKPLGMTAGKSWVLLSNYQTGSLMSNAIGMKAANLMEASAANHIVPVDLYLNGEYRGSYNLTEKVGFANNSVDLADETAAALLELDSYYDEPEGQKFRSTPYNLPINIKEPEFGVDDTRLTLDIVRKDFNSFMAALYKGYNLSRYVDVEQLARFLMVNELICNFELYHPKSTFCYRESFESDTSKYVFGPVWDLDWAFGYEGHSRYYQDNATSNYWINMPNFEVKQFIQDLRWKYAPLSTIYQQLWEEFMQDGLEELKEYVQDYYDFARNSFDDNRSVWGDRTDYAKQVTTATNWLQTRANKIYQDILNGVKPETVTPVEPEEIELANNKLYTITCRRGGLVLNDDHTGIDAGQTRTWATEEEGQFAILSIEGCYYLYSPVTKMFFHWSNNGTWVPELGSPIAFDSLQPDGEYIYMISTTTEDGTTLWFNNNNTTMVINGWNTPDDGDRWLIEEVGDFDPTEALEMARSSMFDVTMNILFDGEIIGSETRQLPRGAEMPEPSETWQSAFVTLEPTGEHPLFVTEDVSVDYDVVWSGPFAFTTSEDDATWYNMTIRSSFVVSKQDTEPYYPAAVDDAESLRKLEYQWAFGGTPYRVRVYNRSTGLSETLTNDGGSVVMRPGDYSWDLLANNDGFVLRVEGTPNTCLNQYGGSRGALKIWNSTSSLKDNGSTLRVALAPEPEYDGLAARKDDASGRQGIFDLSGRRINGTALSPQQVQLKKGVYIVNGQKVAVR